MDSLLPRRRFMSGALGAAAMLAVGPSRPESLSAQGKVPRTGAPGSGSASTPIPSTSRCAPAP